MCRFTGFVYNDNTYVAGLEPDSGLLKICLISAPTAEWEVVHTTTC